LVTAQNRQCSSNEEWSYPVDGCNTCIPILWCEVKQEYGCNCKSGYTRDVIFGICMRRSLCPRNQSIGQYLSVHTDSFRIPSTNRRLEEAVVGD
ncbi:hypothetical protein AVEN_166858-1, partial [Araneus ventricosus]